MVDAVGLMAMKCLDGGAGHFGIIKPDSDLRLCSASYRISWLVSSRSRGSWDETERVELMGEGKISRLDRLEGTKTDPVHDGPQARKSGQVDPVPDKARAEGPAIPSQ
jgi:hypothetical protein